MRNRLITGLMVCLLLLAACSPKTIAPKKTNDINQGKEKEVKPVKKFTQANISILVPFKLDELNIKTASKAEIEKRAMPIDFYQGVKLGVDSAAGSGLNFSLNVIDSQEDYTKLVNVYKNEFFKKSNLIIGPIFPEGLKYISKYSIDNNVAVVSPLAASQPAEFENPNLISIVNNIDLHANRIANYIVKNFNPESAIVVIINPKKAEDEQFAAPLRKYFASLKKPVPVQEYASAYAFETKMVKGKQYAVILTSASKDFVTPTIDKLYKLKNLKTGGYAINLFGHPNWIKQNYQTEKLQALNTVISTSYKVDYKNTSVINFVKKYREKYGFEPSEYAFKGFDIGYYFGGLFAKYGDDFLKYLIKEQYKGLHNSFSFIHDVKYGYINTHVLLLRYKDFSLNTIE